MHHTPANTLQALSFIQFLIHQCCKPAKLPIKQRYVCDDLKIICYCAFCSEDVKVL